MEVKVTIDGKKLKTKEALHAFFKKELEFPDYYGENLDAFWDCLTDAIISDKISIKWIHFKESEKVFGAVYVNHFLEMFEKATTFYSSDTFFSYEIYDKTSKEGKRFILPRDNPPKNDIPLWRPPKTKKSFWRRLIEW